MNRLGFRCTESCLEVKDQLSFVHFPSSCLVICWPFNGMMAMGSQGLNVNVLCVCGTFRPNTLVIRSYRLAHDKFLPNVPITL